ncbi:MAG TPA: response regulator [Candidatus Acidoferrum sp.]|nr:response regulator [Candidatus Acidoferrum sp.]
MAKILVADDNSNIQKMVGLALKDQGIDVVAVGNGEAAVRKISDIHPDLVLADVFMPVRNGYEVCQYVKSDPALSHIPVILLVGAFDPLDEQEAQRVGADGVLKKPFVPPDPLISMVKSALARAGVSLTAANAGKSAAPAQTGEIPAPAASHAPRAAIQQVAAMQSESFVEEIASRPPELKIDSGAHPPAFGSLLETPAVEEEQDSGFTAETNPALERDWRSAEVAEEVEEEEEEEPQASWRRDAGDEAFANDGITGPVHDWRDTVFAESAAAQSGKEKTEFAQADETQDVVVADANETKAVAPAAPFAGDAWATGTSGRLQENVPATVAAEAVPAGVSQKPATPEPVSVQKENEAEAPVMSASEAVPAEPEKLPAASSRFSVTRNPWEAEAQKASQLASSWDAVAVAAPKEPEAAVTKGASVYASETLISEEAAIPAATVEAIRQEAAHVAESVTQETSAAGGTAKTSAAETDMEAMVAKVLKKLNPDMLQALTREILKPVIESIVKDELNAKKP